MFNAKLRILLKELQNHILNYSLVLWKTRHFIVLFFLILNNFNCIFVLKKIVNMHKFNIALQCYHMSLILLVWTFLLLLVTYHVSLISSSLRRWTTTTHLFLYSIFTQLSTILLAYSLAFSSPQFCPATSLGVLPRPTLWARFTATWICCFQSATFWRWWKQGFHLNCNYWLRSFIMSLFWENIFSIQYKFVCKLELTNYGNIIHY